MSKTKLALIIPCYNEELVIESTIRTLLNVLNGIIEKKKISKAHPTTSSISSIYGQILFFMAAPEREFLLEGQQMFLL